jgi:hypothetical protein
MLRSVHPVMKDANDRDTIIRNSKVNHMPLDIAAAISVTNMVTGWRRLRRFGQCLKCRRQQVGVPHGLLKSPLSALFSLDQRGTNGYEARRRNRGPQLRLSSPGRALSSCVRVRSLLPRVGHWTQSVRAKVLGQSDRSVALSGVRARGSPAPAKPAAEARTPLPLFRYLMNARIESASKKCQNLISEHNGVFRCDVGGICCRIGPRFDDREMVRGPASRNTT